MKNTITTKDLGALNELMIFEQWAATKFRHWYDFIEDENLKELFANACISHNERHDFLFDYLTTNSKSGGSSK